MNLPPNVTHLIRPRPRTLIDPDLEARMDDLGLGFDRLGLTDEEQGWWDEIVEALYAEGRVVDQHLRDQLLVVLTLARAHEALMWSRQHVEAEGELGRWLTETAEAIHRRKVRILVELGRLPASVLSRF